MDKTLKFLLLPLIRKASEGNEFLVAPAADCCQSMIENCSQKISNKRANECRSN
eukprot:TRINITY_DN6808_c0_g1_i1.p3 TRINITY_DN6808_c0_g1~~TRINITY_DN6808_c0_g1_i1.p3  ORF type:complete len:54 (-),score=6.55 TRINITY_DN6808_c0_g1_i1:158-319(-)